jgi:hypothetical protein
MFALLFDLEVHTLHLSVLYFTLFRSIDSSIFRLASSLYVRLVPDTVLCLQDYATTYRATRDAYLKAANELKLATGPYKAARDAYVAATATYTKSLYE